MNINIEIERLILNDISLSPSQRAHLQTIVEAELTHLLTTQGIPAPFHKGGTIAKLPAPIRVDPTMTPAQMGQQIARSIYEGMGRSV